MEPQGNMPEANGEFRQIFHQLPEAKLIFRANDPVFTVEEVTDSYLKMIGLQREELIGRSYFEVFPDVTEKHKQTGVSDLAQAFRKVIRTKRPQVQTPFRYDMPDNARHGEYVERYWRTTHYPILGKDGTISHILQVSSDATNEVLYSRELKEVQVHLEEALEIGRVGSWVYDIDSGMVFGDKTLARIFGMSAKLAQHGLPLEEYMRHIYRDDRERVMKSIKAAVQNRSGYTEEYRILVNGNLHWIIVRGKAEMYDGKLRFPGVAVDVTDQRNLQAQIDLARKQDLLNRREARLLHQRNLELENINRTKDEFVALTSHQLRTPATAVKQYLGLVLQGYVGPVDELQREMLAKAFESNERQIQIINQILNAARADTGKLSMSLRRLDLNALVKSITDEMRSGVENKEHTFTVLLPASPVYVHADQGYLRMAIENLVNNANAYTQPGGTITVSLTVTGRKAELAVRDTGVGIKKSDIPKLFSKFSRIHNPLSVQAGGSGIGLYLAGEILRLHAGHISVASRIHAGTVFTIQLPLLPPSAAKKPLVSRPSE